MQRGNASRTHPDQHAPIVDFDQQQTLPGTDRKRFDDADATAGLTPVPLQAPCCPGCQRNEDEDDAEPREHLDGLAGTHWRAGRSRTGRQRYERAERARP